MTDQMALLAAKARLYRPRLFAIYGRRRSTDGPFLGWGMAFDRLDSTLYYQHDTQREHPGPAPDVARAHLRHRPARVPGPARLRV